MVSYVSIASISKVNTAQLLIDRMSRENPEILKRCSYLSEDRGYGDDKLHWFHEVKTWPAEKFQLGNIIE